MSQSQILHSKGLDRSWNFSLPLKLRYFISFIEILNSKWFFVNDLFKLHILIFWSTRKFYASQKCIVFISWDTFEWRKKAVPEVSKISAFWYLFWSSFYINLRFFQEIKVSRILRLANIWTSLGKVSFFYFQLICAQYNPSNLWSLIHHYHWKI